MMNFCMAGIDHSRATVEYRELFSFTKTAAAEAMRRVRAEFGAEGCAIIVTCNRTELWIDWGEKPARDPYKILCALKGVIPEDYRELYIQRNGGQALDHLLELACGMKSRVFGEDQIITQVGAALDEARACGCADAVLERLFRTAVTAAKRVKTTVRLAPVGSSVALRVVELLRELRAGLAGLRCLVIGNGEMGRLTAGALVEQGCDVKMTLRRYKTGEVVIPPGCRAIPYEERLDEIARTDVVVSATASPHHTLRYEEVLPYLDGSPKLFFDLAVPRDISSRLSGAPGVSLYDIDSLGAGCADEAQNAAVAAARGILGEYRREFEDWYYFRSLVPLVNEISTLAAVEITGRIHKTIERLDVDNREQEQLREAVEHASVRVVGKLLYGLRDNLERDRWEECIKSMEKAVKP